MADNKILENLTVEERLEVASRALLRLIVRFESALKRFETESWAQCIRREIDRRDKMDLTKGKHLWRQHKSRPRQKLHSPLNRR